jgi:hypothetical protein
MEDNLKQNNGRQPQKNGRRLQQKIEDDLKKKLFLNQFFF